MTTYEQSPSALRVALAQAPSVLGDVETNWAAARHLIARAAVGGANLIVFPETYLQGYLADEAFARTAVTLPGPFQDDVVKEAVDHGLVVVMGLARADAAFPHLVYNSALLARPDGTTTIYDKIHLGTYGPYREGCFFAPGRTIAAVDAPFGRLGIEICSDISFPEVARVLALDGALLHVVLSAGPDEFKDSWPCLLKVRSMENAFFTVYVNTVGRQRDVNFFGGSRVVDPSGRTVAEAPHDEEALLLVDIDLSLAIERRRTRLLFRDRVPELYRAITDPSRPG